MAKLSPAGDNLCLKGRAHAVLHPDSSGPFPFWDCPPPVCCGGRPSAWSTPRALQEQQGQGQWAPNGEGRRHTGLLGSGWGFLPRCPQGHSTLPEEGLRTPHPRPPTLPAACSPLPHACHFSLLSFAEKREFSAQGPWTDAVYCCHDSRRHQCSHGSSHTACGSGDSAERTWGVGGGGQGLYLGADFLQTL